jgi:hypothetical protein
VDQNDENGQQDPFAELENWAKQTERRVRREGRRGIVRKVASWGFGAVVVALLVVASIPLVREFRTGPSGAAPAVTYPTQAVPSGVTVTTSASAKPSDPFEGTPAAAYPKGAAGITLPPAKAVEGFTATQVRDSLQKVHQALVATHLDHAMLVDHKPGTFLAMLAPGQRDDIGGWFRTRDFTTLAVWIDPAVKLDPGQQPRVSGRVTYSSVLVDGRRTLRITTNFIWVYAFTGTEEPIAAAHDEVRWEFSWSPRLRASDHGMVIAKTDGYNAWVDCAAAAKGLLAPTRTQTAPAPTNSESDDEYLRADHSLDIGDNCHLTPTS